MKPADIHRSIRKLQLKASADLDCRVHRDLDQALAESNQTHPARREPAVRRLIMRHPITKLAAAAVIVVAITLGIVPFLGGTITFADVIQPILNARTVVYDFIVGDEAKGPVIHDVVVGNRIRRTILGMDGAMILDLDNGKMLTLDPKTKGAAHVDIQGTVEEGTRCLMELVRTIVAKVQDDPNVPVQDLGQRDINGIKTIGFQVTQHRPPMKLNIWADPKTATPKRIELYIGQSVTILKNIEFDVPVDEALVSMDVPDGYSVLDQELDMSSASEEDFVATLRVWAETVLDGQFPDSMGTQEYLQATTALTEAIEQQATSEDELMQMGESFGKGVVFLQMLSVQGEWHYAGKGVRFGDGDTAVFWYRNDKQAKTYRVIYGDLHVEEVTLDRLPQ